MKAKNLLARALSGLGALLAVAIAGLFAEPAVFEEEAEEATTQPEEGAGTEPAGGAVIDTSSWDELSKQVLPKVIESNLDFGTLLRYARKASCTVYMVVKTPQIAMPELGSFTVPQGPPSTARISLSWEDANDDGTIAEDEVKIETRYTSDIGVKMAMDRVHKGLKNLVTLSVVNLLTQSTVKAERKGQGYEITVNPKKGAPVPVRLTVSGDFRITSTQTRSLDGSDVVNNLKHTRTGGKWLVTGAETTSGAGTDFTSTDKWGNEYVTQDGIPLLARVTIASTSSTGGGVLQTQQEYSFRDWQIEKRAEPLEVVIEPTGVEETRVEPARVQETRAETPRTQEARARTPKTVVRPAKRAGAPRVRILRTEQANKLAKDTILSVGNAYYDVAAAGVTGYDASFAVQLDGEPVGGFKLKWEAFGGASIEPDLADEEAKGRVEAIGQQIARVVSGGPLSDYSFAADVYASRSPKQTIIDATEHAAASDPNVRSDLVSVSQDLSQVRTTHTINDGKTAETVYAGEEFEGKLFVRSATQTVKEPGGTPEKTEYTWTYSRREGVPFVKRLEWSGTVGEQTGEWTIILENVTFEKEVARIRIDRGARPAGEEVREAASKKVEELKKLLQEGKVPRTEEARKLALEVAVSAMKSYYSLWSTDVAGFDASFSMELQGRPMGTLKARWHRPDTDPTVTLEGVEEKAKKLAELFAGLELRPLMQPAVAAGPEVYAMKWGDNYVMDASEALRKELPKSQGGIMSISADLTEVLVVNVVEGGDVLESVYRGQPADGRIFRSSAVETIGGEPPVIQEFQWTYAQKEGIQFIERVIVDQSVGTSGTVQWTLTLKNVTFERGAEPVDFQKEMEEEQDARRRVEEAEKKLGETINQLLEKEREKWLRRDKQEGEEEKEE
jgi:hypothetical protein